MVVSIGADHGGFLQKEYLKTKFPNIKFNDVGAFEMDEADDYTKFSFAVAEEVASGRADFGIMICRTGVGAVIAMNKVFGIRAGLCERVEDCETARRKNNINILSYGADNVCRKRAVKIVEKFISTDFDGGRHKRRMDAIFAYEVGKSEKK